MGFSGIKIVENSYANDKLKLVFAFPHSPPTANPFLLCTSDNFEEKQTNWYLKPININKKGRSKIIDAKIKCKHLNKQTNNEMTKAIIGKNYNSIERSSDNSMVAAGLVYELARYLYAASSNI